MTNSVDVGAPIRDGWYQVITGVKQLTTVAYLYESGGWFFPDPDFNEADMVGGNTTPLYSQAEVDEMLDRVAREASDV